MTTRVIAKAKPGAIQKVHTYAPLDCFTTFAMTWAIKHWFSGDCIRRHYKAKSGAIQKGARWIASLCYQ
jgi:hypothetical protein